VGLALIGKKETAKFSPQQARKKGLSDESRKSVFAARRHVDQSFLARRRRSVASVVEPTSTTRRCCAKKNKNR